MPEAADPADVAGALKAFAKMDTDIITGGAGVTVRHCCVIHHKRKIPRFFKMLPNNLDLRCVLRSAPVGPGVAGCQTRLDSSIQRTDHIVFVRVAQVPVRHSVLISNAELARIKAEAMTVGGKPGEWVSTQEALAAFLLQAVGRLWASTPSDKPRMAGKPGAVRFWRKARKAVGLTDTDWTGMVGPLTLVHPSTLQHVHVNMHPVAPCMPSMPCPLPLLNIERVAPKRDVCVLYSSKLAGRLYPDHPVGEGLSLGTAECPRCSHPRWLLQRCAAQRERETRTDRDKESERERARETARERRKRQRQRQRECVCMCVSERASVCVCV